MNNTIDILDTIEFKKCTWCGRGKQLNKDNFVYNKRHANYQKRCKVCSDSFEKGIQPFEKQCHTCKIIMPLDEKHFKFFKKRRYFNCDCIDCEIKKTRVEVPRNKQKNETETCKRCGKTLPHTEEFFVKHCRSKNLSKVRCKKCATAQKYAERDKRKETDPDYTRRVSIRFRDKLNADPIRLAERNRKLRERKRSDPTFRLKCNLRGRMHSAIMEQKGFKRGRSEQLIGCKYEEVRAYIESKFTTDMSWDNYGLHGWHVDHIIPIDAFDLTKEEEQYKCFHYTNLRPLWETREIAIAHGEPEDYIGNLNKLAKIL